MKNLVLLDCTLRDGGYYNNWDFDQKVINEYLLSMNAAAVNYVELGLRSFQVQGFKGACAYTTDNFIRSLTIPKELKVAVMVNASELINHKEGVEKALSKLFTNASESPVTLVRIACHIDEFKEVLIASNWLKEHGYVVGYNLMQIADRKKEEIKEIATLANQYPIDVLYFADSMGSLNPEEVAKIIRIFQSSWKGPLGIHTHDNLGFALANSIRAIEEGVLWIDGTVTGMGRGPGNAKTEYLVIELESIRHETSNISSLMSLIKKHFKPMQNKYGWGTNTYYYLSGKYKIHPTYIQYMLNDTRYNEEDILAIIEYLKTDGGKKFNIETIENGKMFYTEEATGTWRPESVIGGREVLIIGSGPGIKKHRQALENYIKRENPFVIALNTQTPIDQNLINIRAACHPVRLLADSIQHMNLPQPLVTPVSMLPPNIRDAFDGKELLDFGISVQPNTFLFSNNSCVLPSSLVVAYALAIAASGSASKILLAGFDGYGAEDSRTKEVNDLLENFIQSDYTPQVLAITPTQYKIASSSVYAF